MNEFGLVDDIVHTKYSMKPRLHVKIRGGENYKFDPVQKKKKAKKIADKGQDYYKVWLRQVAVGDSPCI